MHRALRLSLALPIAAVATLPLHLGREWVWKVTSPRQSLATIGSQRSALVTDSAADSHGTIWTLAVNDSTTNKSETAKILQLPDKRQYWLEKASLLDWELVPVGEYKDTSLVVGGESLCGWGAPWNTCGNKSAGLTTWRLFDGSINITFCAGIAACAYSKYPIPTGEWSDSLGMVSSEVHTNGIDAFWKLVRFDKKRIPTRSRLTPPKTGTVLVWNYSHDSTRTDPNHQLIVRRHSQGSLEWTIEEVATLAEGWSRVRIRSRDRSHCWSDTGMAFSHPVAGCRDDQASRIVVRIHPDHEPICDSGFSRGLERGWVSDTLQSHTSRWGQWGSNPESRGISEVVDSGRMDRLRLSHEISSDTGLREEWEFLLASVDGNPIRDTSRSGISDHPRRTESLRALCRNHPETEVRWHTLAGRGSRISADGLEGLLARNRGQMLLIDARFPGKRWTGPVFSPGL